MRVKELTDKELFVVYDAISNDKSDGNELCQKVIQEYGNAAFASENVKDEVLQRWSEEQQAMSRVLMAGDKVWYANKEYGEVERGIVDTVYYKNGKLETIGVNFPDSGDFDELIGEALGSTLFRSQKEAMDCLTDSSDPKELVITAYAFNELPAVVKTVLDRKECEREVHNLKDAGYPESSILVFSRVDSMT